MAFGFAFQTNNGLKDYSQIKSVRLLYRGLQSMPTGSDFERVVSIPLTNKNDLTGPIILRPSGVRIPVSTGRLYDLSLRIDESSIYYANAANIPNNIDVQICGRSHSNESGNAKAFIEIMGFQV